MMLFNEGINNQQKTIELEANPTTGYDWSFKLSAGGEDLITVTKQYRSTPTKEPLCGSGGTDIFTIVSKKEGICEITFTYERSWEPSEDDLAEVYTIEIDRDLNIIISK